MSACTVFSGRTAIGVVKHRVQDGKLLGFREALEREFDFLCGRSGKVRVYHDPTGVTGHE